MRHMTCSLLTAVLRHVAVCAGLTTKVGHDVAFFPLPPNRDIVSHELQQLVPLLSRTSEEARLISNDALRLAQHMQQIGGVLDDMRVQALPQMRSMLAMRPLKETQLLQMPFSVVQQVPQPLPPVALQGLHLFQSSTLLQSTMPPFVASMANAALAPQTSLLSGSLQQRPPSPATPPAQQNVLHKVPPLQPSPDNAPVGQMRSEPGGGPQQQEPSVSYAPEEDIGSHGGKEVTLPPSAAASILLRNNATNSTSTEEDSDGKPSGFGMLFRWVFTACLLSMLCCCCYFVYLRRIKIQQDQMAARQASLRHEQHHQSDGQHREPQPPKAHG